MSLPKFPKITQKLAQNRKALVNSGGIWRCLKRTRDICRKAMLTPYPFFTKGDKPSASTNWEWKCSSSGAIRRWARNRHIRPEKAVFDKFDSFWVRGSLCAWTDPVFLNDVQFWSCWTVCYWARASLQRKKRGFSFSMLFCFRFFVFVGECHSSFEWLKRSIENIFFDRRISYFDNVVDNGSPSQSLFSAILSCWTMWHFQGEKCVILYYHPAYVCLHAA